MRIFLSVHFLFSPVRFSSSGAGEFEDDGERDGADGDESEVFGGEVEQDVQGGGGFFFHGRYSL